ncbi:MAG: hypothetical protein KF865_15120 [Bdellovibrionaceae bacterium]|nr:hypothetical protein [Pseudobdellovibrionaceae bacterium]
MNIRFVIQPLVAILLAVRAGLRDARAGHPPFLWTLATNKSARARLLGQGFKEISQVFALAIILDGIYQILTVKGIYLLELLFTAIVLAIVPYVLVRGPASRVARWFLSARQRRGGDATPVI